MNSIIIYPPTINWKYMKQRPQQLMEQFGKDGHVVFYFDKHNADGPVLEEAAANVFVIRHADFFLHHLYPYISANTKTLLWTSWSRQIAFADTVQADHIIYDCVDDFPEWEADEQSLAVQADVIFCTADSLWHKMRKLHPDKPIALVPNGCDWEHFAPVALPTYAPIKRLYDLPPAHGPKIGYIGAWAPWVDEHWIRHAAQQLPQGQLIIVGPKLREDTGALGGNVHWLGLRDYEELPHILSYLDVCIIPFRLNRITRSTNPIKAYEFLAAGKPVVSSNLPEMQKLLPYVRLADSPSTFVEAIRQCMKELSVKSAKEASVERSRFARQFSWEHRYHAIKHTLQETLSAFSSPNAQDLIHQHALLYNEYLSTSYPLRHCTMNSYYPNTNLHEDPVLVGRTNAGEYQCLLMPPIGQLPENIERIYLEFDHVGDIPKDAELEVSLVHTPWTVRQLTFANQPPNQSMRRFMLKQHRINDTIALDMTAHLPVLMKQADPKSTPNSWLPSIHLSSSTGMLRLSRPRIVIITSQGHKPGKGDKV